jgi:hypothetical protein
MSGRRNSRPNCDVYSTNWQDLQLESKTDERLGPRTTGPSAIATACEGVWRE